MIVSLNINEIEIEYAMPSMCLWLRRHRCRWRLNCKGPKLGFSVGAESAGANPGPICHGLGIDLPTITDANALLGRLDIEQFHRKKHQPERIKSFSIENRRPSGVDASTHRRFTDG